MTQNGWSQKSFFIGGSVGILINISACFLDPTLEAGTKHVVRMSCWERTKHNFRQVKKGFQTRELARSFIFFVIMGGVIPRYDDYMYFYLTSDLYMDFDKLTYAYMKLAAFFGMFVGATLYATVLKSISIRTMMIIACMINCLSAVGQVVFLKGWYAGMHPALFYGFVEQISDSFSQAFIQMPEMALVAKLIPPTIESTFFAFFTGVGNLTFFFLGRLLGNMFNLYYDVTKEDMSNLWKLHVIQAICSLIPLCFIWLLPETDEVKAVQKRIKDEEDEVMEQELQGIEANKVSKNTETNSTTINGGEGKTGDV